MAHTEGTFADGRSAQYREMMERLDALQARYKGVRGQLLAKVREALMQLEPGAQPRAQSSSPSASSTSPSPRKSPHRAPVAKATPPPPEPLQLLPSCRACGRTMRPTGSGTLVCQNGHTRFLAG